MRVRISVGAILVIAAAALTGSSQAKHASTSSLSPQAVLDWNANAWTVVSQAQHPREVTPPATRSLFQTEGLLYMSYAQAAVYNAAVAIEGRYEPYGYSLFAPGGASADAAVAQAAHDTLKYYLGPMLTAAQVATLDGWLTSSLAAIPNGQAKTDGISVGQAAALGIEAIRANDGRDGPQGNYGTGPVAPGAWVLTPGPFTFAQTPWLKDMHPFILDSPDQFKSQPPPELRSEKWAKDFNEIKAYGSATSTVRTDAQTKTAYFWNANVVNQVNREFRDAAAQYGLDLVDTARLLAAGDMVITDTGMACWANKYSYLFWRPLTAIQNAGIDGNPNTQADATWAPLVTHPNHPEWPSAHGCVTGSDTQVISELAEHGSGQHHDLGRRKRRHRPDDLEALRLDQGDQGRGRGRSGLGRLPLPLVCSRGLEAWREGRALGSPARLQAGARRRLTAVTGGAAAAAAPSAVLRQGSGRR